MTTPSLPFAVFDEFGNGADDRVQDFIHSALAADRAAENAEGWSNFDLLMKVTDWFIERGKLLTNRTEEADGPMAAALNIIDSIEALVAADRAATAPEPNLRVTFAAEYLTGYMQDEPEEARQKLRTLIDAAINAGVGKKT